MEEMGLDGGPEVWEEGREHQRREQAVSYSIARELNFEWWVRNRLCRPLNSWLKIQVGFYE